MWTIVRYKKNELNILIKNLKDKLANKIIFYQPLVKVSLLKNNKLTNKSKPLLNDYIFCYSSSFNNSEGLRTIMNTKGLKSMLGDCSKSQTEIIKFIESCKKK